MSLIVCIGWQRMLGGKSPNLFAYKWNFYFQLEPFLLTIEASLLKNSTVSKTTVGKQASPRFQMLRTCICSQLASKVMFLRAHLPNQIWGSCQMQKESWHAAREFSKWSVWVRFPKATHTITPQLVVWDNQDTASETEIPLPNLGH